MNIESQNNIALITGGSSGIGLAIAHELAALNYNLLLVSNQSENLVLAKKTFEETYNINCRVLDLDLANTTAPQQIVDFCAANQLQVEVLINNAGRLIMSEITDISPDDISRIIQLHVHTPTMLCRLFGAEMKARRQGHIMNVSSISAVMPYPIISLYGPTKTYLRYFTRALRTEMQPHGVNVTCLIPGATITGLYNLTEVNVSLLKSLGIFHTPQFVSRKAVRGLMRRKARVVPGLINKITMVFMPWMPTFIIARLNRHKNASF